MHHSFPVYSVTVPLHVSGLLLAHHQDFDSIQPADSLLKRTTRTNCRIYTLLPPDDGLLANPKHVEI
jgi:hypothetical protein